MADLKLDLLVPPTYDVKTLNVLDASVYPQDLVVEDALLEILVPGFDVATVEFSEGSNIILRSDDLNLTDEGVYDDLPDGVYVFRYSINPNYQNFVERTIMRVNRIQEKFDKAFLQLDLMECDAAIKKQSKVDLNTIYMYIQGAIAAANNCAADHSAKLYLKADALLDRFLNGGCDCLGNNYLTNF